MRTYSDSETQVRLDQTLPAWKLDHGAICRTYKTAGWQATILVVGAIAHLAEAAGHHPDLAVSYASVEVRLSTHDAGGITERDFGLAARIEEVVLWHPGAAPADYVTYDG
jgi:pterin-4a-carbinolamine dehydratase